MMNSESCIIIGVDTFIGSHLAKAMAASGHRVIGYGTHDVSVLSDTVTYQSTDYLHYNLSADCHQVFFCHDVALDRDRHVQALAALCEHLAAIHSKDRQVHLAYFSSTNICNANGRRISEDSEIYPHCLRDSVVAQAEMLLRAWCSLSDNAISPHVFRYGELYGEEDCFPTPAGHVNECLAMARRGKALVFYGNLNQKRTLTHIDDFATAVVEVLRHGLAPSRVNIPGEHLMVVDFLMGISGHYGVDWEPVASRPAVVDENVPFASSDRLLNAAIFKSIVPNFKPKHHFKSWLSKLSG